MRFATTGRPLAQTGGSAASLGPATTVYAQAERVVWRAPSGSARRLTLLSGFQQDVGGHATIQTYLVSGAVFNGPLASRPNDSLGVLFQHQRLGERQVGALDDLLAIREDAQRLPRSETIVEVNYEAQIARGLHVKPYAAIVVNPDQLGSVAPVPDLRHAVLAGVRFSIYLGPALGLPQISRPN